MFTLEIGGKPVAVTDCDESGAQELLGRPDFREDLLSLQSDGRPIWDGSAPLTFRRSSTEETQAFEHGMEEDEDDADDAPDRNDETGAPEDLATIMFLVSIDDETAEDGPGPLSGRH
jgi:hypothetical protein